MTVQTNINLPFKTLPQKFKPLHLNKENSHLNSKKCVFWKKEISLEISLWYIRNLEVQLYSAKNIVTSQWLIRFYIIKNLKILKIFITLGLSSFRVFHFLVNGLRRQLQSLLITWKNILINGIKHYIEKVNQYNTFI